MFPPQPTLLPPLPSLIPSQTPPPNPSSSKSTSPSPRHSLQPLPSLRQPLLPLHIPVASSLFPPSRSVSHPSLFRFSLLLFQLLTLSDFLYFPSVSRWSTSWFFKSSPFLLFTDLGLAIRRLLSIHLRMIGPFPTKINVRVKSVDCVGGGGGCGGMGLDGLGMRWEGNGTILKGTEWYGMIWDRG